MNQFRPVKKLSRMFLFVAIIGLEIPASFAQVVCDPETHYDDTMHMCMPNHADPHSCG